MNIAVITGASKGIGREFACQLDNYGLDELWLIARSRDKLVDLQKWLSTPCRILELDLTKQECLTAYATELKEVCPNIMYLINDSGFGKFGRYHEISLLDTVDIIDLNIKALVLMTLHSLPFMSEGSGIIQMSSAAAFTPLPNFNVYAASKAFVYHYSLALRAELRSREIAVTAVCPGWTASNFLDTAEPDCTLNRPKKFVPIYSAEKVVQKALSDLDNDRPVSVYGFYTKLHKLASKVLPNCVLIAKWLAQQAK